MLPNSPINENQLQVLRALASNPHTNQRELASALGISLGKTNYCLKALFNKGFIKIDNFKSNKNKLGYIYLLTPAGISAKAELTARFLKWKMQEYEDLTREIELLKAEYSSLQDLMEKPHG